MLDPRLEGHKCRKCGKKVYSSRAKAKKGLKQMQPAGRKVKGTYRDDSCYPPYVWHVTSQPPAVAKAWDRYFANDYPT